VTDIQNDAELPPEGDERATAYIKLKQENAQKFKSLSDRGVPMNPVDFINAQFEALLDLLGDEARSAWAFLFEHRVSLVLAEKERTADETVARQTLLGGLGEPIIPKLIRP
jgi:hypothetical protein